MRGTMNLFEELALLSLMSAPLFPGRLELNSFVSSSEFAYILRGSASLT
jgi:hypothetical protein